MRTRTSDGEAVYATNKDSACHLDHAVASCHPQELTAAERARVAGDRDALMLKDQELFNVQREAEIATRKAKFYKETLAELAMFKSKTDVALLQAQERLSMDAAEAASLEKRYNDAYQGAQKQFEEGMRLRDAVQQVRFVQSVCGVCGGMGHCM